MSEQENDKPVLLKAVEPILADPAEIRKGSPGLLGEFKQRLSDTKSDDEINETCSR